MDERSEIHCLRRLDLRHEGVNIFRGKVRTVRPCERMAFQRKLLEVVRVLQRLKNGPIQFISEIDLPFGSIAELYPDTMAVEILRFFNMKEFHYSRG